MDATRTASVVRSGAGYTGLQGLTYAAGLTAASAGARGICMVVLTVPPGTRARAHLHRGIETAAYVIEGGIEVWSGERLEVRQALAAGDYSYVPADTPHVVLNRTGRPCVAVVAHTAPDDQQGIVMLPELDAVE